MLCITVKVDGMMCGMCEAHVNDAVRRSLPVKKVTSDHKKGVTVILAEQDIPDDRIEAVIRDSGYTPTGIIREAESPRGLKALFKK